MDVPLGLSAELEKLGADLQKLREDNRHRRRRAPGLDPARVIELHHQGVTNAGIHTRLRIPSLCIAEIVRAERARQGLPPRKGGRPKITPA